MVLLPKSPSPGRFRSGFTLIEIMIVVIIIGLLAALAIPAFVKARTRSLDTRFVNDLKQAAAAFEVYALERGTFPADVYPGIMPAGMASYLPKRIDWSLPTPIGGSWDWDNNQFGGLTGVSVHLPDRTVEQMRAVDRLFDDGDLTRGAFRSRPNGYIYLIDR